MGADLFERGSAGEGIGRYWGASGTGECGTLCCVFVYVPRGGLTKTPTPGNTLSLLSFSLIFIYLFSPSGSGSFGRPLLRKSPAYSFEKKSFKIKIYIF